MVPLALLLLPASFTAAAGTRVAVEVPLTQSAPAPSAAPVTLIVSPLPSGVLSVPVLAAHITPSAAPVAAAAAPVAVMPVMAIPAVPPAPAASVAQPSAAAGRERSAPGGERDALEGRVLFDQASREWTIIDGAPQPLNGEVSRSRKSQSLEQPSLEQMREFVTAVHVTDQFPEGGILKAAIHKGMGFRPSVHFALGQMVIAHEAGNWENKSFAVLVPFQQIEAQLLNVFPQDTFILGDLKLGPGSIVIAKSGEKVPSMPGVEILTYDPMKTTIRQKIDRVLKERKQWLFRARGGHESDPVSLNGRPLDQELFFKSVFEKYPWVTVGIHAVHPMGRIDHLMSANFGIFRDPKYSAERSYLGWTLMLERTRQYFRESDHLALNFKNRDSIQAAYQNAKNLFDQKLNIFEAEIKLQKSHGKTLLGTADLPPEFLNQIRDISAAPDQLMRFLIQNRNKLNDLSVDKEEKESLIYDYDLAQIRESSSENDFSSFLKREPEVAKLAGGLDFQLGLRKIELSLKTIKDHNDRSELRRNFINQLRSCKFDQCGIILFQLLQPEALPDKNAILRDPEVAAHLSRLFDLRAFTDLKPEDDDVNGWIWFARELKDSKDKDHWWAEGLRLYHFKEVQPHHPSRPALDFPLRSGSLGAGGVGRPASPSPSKNRSARARPGRLAHKGRSTVVLNPLMKFLRDLESNTGRNRHGCLPA